MPDQSSEMRSDEGFAIESEHGQGHVVHRVFRRRVPDLKPLVRSEFLYVLQGDANPRRHAESNLFHPLSTARDLTFGISEQKTDSTSSVEFPEQSCNEMRLIQPKEIIRVAGEEKIICSVGGQLPPNRRRTRRTVGVRANNLLVATRLDSIFHRFRPQHILVNSQHRGYVFPISGVRDQLRVSHPSFNGLARNANSKRKLSRRHARRLHSRSQVRIQYLPLGRLGVLYGSGQTSGLSPDLETKVPDGSSPWTDTAPDAAVAARGVTHLGGRPTCGNPSGVGGRRRALL